MRTCTRPRSQGFTLIELMVALAVAGILAAIAYPAYTSHLLRGRRADAISALTAIMQAQERYRSNNASYASTVGDLGVDISKITPLYDVTLSGANFNIGYVATATPISTGKQARDLTCKTLVMTLTGATPVYSATGDPSNSGTNRDTTSECWPR